jgi:hypothetical protein
MVLPLVFFTLSATMFLSPPVITVIGVSLLTMLSVVPIIRSRNRRLSSDKNRSPFSGVLFSNIYITLCFVIQWIYVVVTIDQTILRNPVIYDGPRFPINFGLSFPFGDNGV